MTVGPKSRFSTATTDAAQPRVARAGFTMRSKRGAIIPPVRRPTRRPSPGVNAGSAAANSSRKSRVIPTPFYTYVYYHGDKWAQYGEERTRWMFAHRSFLDHGIRVAGASDHVPGPYEPLMAIQSMVTRKDYRGRVWGDNQKVTVDEALLAGLPA